MPPEEQDSKMMPDNDEYEVVFDYEFLEDFQDNEKGHIFRLLETLRRYVAMHKNKLCMNAYF